MNDGLVVLENWYIVYTKGQNDFNIPFPSAALCGTCYGHKKYEDGTFVRTSNVKDIKGNIVTTSNNTRYYLATPDKAYEMWLWLAKCKKLDRKNPFDNLPPTDYNNPT